MGLYPAMRWSKFIKFSHQNLFSACCPPDEKQEGNINIYYIPRYRVVYVTEGGGGGS